MLWLGSTGCSILTVRVADLAGNVTITNFDVSSLVAFQTHQDLKASKIRMETPGRIEAD